MQPVVHRFMECLSSGCNRIRMESMQAGIAPESDDFARYNDASNLTLISRPLNLADVRGRHPLSAAASARESTIRGVPLFGRV